VDSGLEGRGASPRKEAPVVSPQGPNQEGGEVAELFGGNGLGETSEGEKGVFLGKFPGGEHFIHAEPRGKSGEEVPQRGRHPYLKKKTSIGGGALFIREMKE